MNQTKHLLVVDDDESLRTALGKILEKAGYRITLARDGEEAVALLGRESFDLILTDFKMPGKNGFAIAREVAARGAEQGVPVILMTAYGEICSYLEALRLGFHEYIQKPIGRAKLLRIIEGVLEGSGRSPVRKDATPQQKGKPPG